MSYKYSYKYSSSNYPAGEEPSEPEPPPEPSEAAIPDRSPPAPFDTAPDREELLDYVMWRQNGPQKRELAIENLRSLDAFGLAQLRAEMRQSAREKQRAGNAEYDMWRMN